MENFIFHNPTKIIFGKGTHKNVGSEVKKYSRRILFHYGGGSIKKSGLHDEIVSSLRTEGIEFIEFGGVEPNPKLGPTIEGAKICRENNIDFILAAGGGSVIDSAKAIALNVPYSGESMWDFIIGKAKPVSALSTGVILTIPASGSESSDATVITEERSGIKKSCHNNIIRPKFAILNPELTFTLPDYQLACGIADMMSHVMERYFSATKYVDLTDRLCEATMITIMENALPALENPGDYNPRAELMWAGTFAHNDLLGAGRTGDWGSHKIAHELSTYCGLAHGASIAIVFPSWMEYVYKKDIDMFYKFAVRVFGIDPCFGSREEIAAKGISRLREFFESIKLPLYLKDIGVGSGGFEEMSGKATAFGTIGKYLKLEKDDVIKIYKIALNP